MFLSELGAEGRGGSDSFVSEAPGETAELSKGSHFKLVIGRVPGKPPEQQDWLILAPGAQMCSLFLGFVPRTAKVSYDSHTFSIVI